MGVRGVAAGAVAADGAVVPGVQADEEAEEAEAAHDREECECGVHGSTLALACTCNEWQ
ncbi:hypothetical protein LO771_10740 [Streptacidiphilus sp. ASG 303]|uniref:hypothetical protein n=1 Tax=Streptacidiphilus sp. ASG 303 TaxID=2896847 RepID=UPI001E458D5D|nr:hypothetical protein [Streptacidiphilus sp. ASG 303]MCD0482862.1 hypothetical protein [Streptacidiphilus sp. ASG 303]